MLDQANTTVQNITDRFRWYMVDKAANEEQPEIVLIRIKELEI